MMKKVLLVVPSYVQVPGLFQQSPPVPPLGSAYLASYLRRRMGESAEVRLIDANTLQFSDERTLKAIREFQPDVLGMSAVAMVANKIKRLFEQTKASFPDCLTVTGGPHASACSWDMAPHCDFVARAEGEITFAELVEAWPDREAMEQVPGLAWRDPAGALQHSQPREYVKDLDDLPFPAYDQLPMERYEHHYPHRTRNQRFFTMFTSRGCPWSCDFCQKDAVWANRVRFRSLDNSFAEIHELTDRWNVSFIFFYDDTFTVKKNRLKEICRRMNDENVSVKWSCLTRADCLTEEMVEMMAASKCAEVQLGIESGDQEVLNSINKKQTLDTVRDAFGWLKKYGVKQKGFLIFGHYNDTRRSLKNTLRFAMEIDPTWVFFSSLVPFPGSKLHEKYKEKGFIDSYDWNLYNYHGKTIVHTDNFTAEDIDQLKMNAYRAFYLRPKKLWRFALDTITAKGYRRMWKNLLAFLDLINPISRKTPKVQLEAAGEAS